MKNWKLGLITAGSVVLLSPTLKMGLNNVASLFLLVMAVRGIVRFFKAFWKPLLVMAALIYLFS